MYSDEELPSELPSLLDEHLHENDNATATDQPETVPAEGEEDNGSDNEQQPQRIAPKKIVRNPQPKLDAERLKSKRGLAALPSYFERIKFKGKGHEEEDLNVILKTYEYWCHRLFPKFTFDESISKIEHLGSKRPVMTIVKKIRMDLDIDEIQAEPGPEDVDGSLDDNQMEEDLDEPPSSQVVTQISEEQLEIIRLNKEKAERLRRERLARARNDTVFDSLRSESQVNVNPTPLTEEFTTEGREPVEDTNLSLTEEGNNMDLEVEMPESGKEIDTISQESAE